MRSPTSRPIVRPGGAARGRDLGARADHLPAGRPDPAAPAGAQRGRGEPAARTSTGRPCCGPSTWTPTARRSACAWSGRGSAAGPSSTTSGVQRRGRRGHRRRADTRCCPSWARCWPRRAADRGAVNLPLPEQEVERDGDGWRLVLRAPLPVEEHNAQISLLTGMAAARLMLAGGVGLLRTMPAPQAGGGGRSCGPRPASLGVPWPDGRDGRARWWPRSTRPARAGRRSSTRRPSCCAARPTRRSTGAAPAETGHGGVGAPYAHVTAPLRRLADRYATEVCLALHAGRPVPGWAREALPRCPRRWPTPTGWPVGRPGRGRPGRGGAAGRTGWVRCSRPACAGPGRSRPAKRPASAARSALDDPAVRARCLGDLPLGERVPVRLHASPTRRRRDGSLRAAPGRATERMSVPARHPRRHGDRAVTRSYRDGLEGVLGGGELAAADLVGELPGGLGEDARPGRRSA